MQKPEDVDEFSPNDTLEIKSVRGSYELRGGGGFVLCGSLRARDRRLIGMSSGFASLFTLFSAYSPNQFDFATRHTVGKPPTRPVPDAVDPGQAGTFPHVHHPGST
jgi:hypothetical protein